MGWFYLCLYYVGFVILYYEYYMGEYKHNGQSIFHYNQNLNKTAHS